jgi:sulfopyruvate decarboxylase subunit beta
MIERSVATKYITDHIGNDEMVVATLGNAKYDLFNAKDRPRNFYMWNSMGMACSIGLGLAMAQPEHKVIILDGDGSLLMNLSSLATEAVREPKNLIHIVWDNRVYEQTGGQPTATHFKTDLAKVAEGAGFQHVDRVESLPAFQKAFDRAMKEPGPWFILALIEPGRAKPPRPPRSPTFIKHRFMTDLGLPPEG